MSEDLYPAEQWEKFQQMQDAWNSNKVQVGDGQATAIGGTSGQAWGGTYPPPEPKHVCPHCGYCPHCGRGGGYVPYYPLPYQPWPNYPWPYVGDLPGYPNGTTITWTLSK